MIQGVKQEDQKDFLEEMTLELGCKGWIGTSKVNKRRMTFPAEEENAWRMLQRDIKNPRKWKWTQVDGSRVSEGMELFLLSGWTLTVESVMFSTAYFCFPLCTDVYRYITFMSIYIHIALVSSRIRGNAWIFLKRSSTDMSYGKTRGICSN